MVRVVFGIFGFQEFAERGVVDFRRSGLVLGARLILHQESSDVREGSGATRGDAVAGERFKEFAEDMVDVDVGDVITGETSASSRNWCDRVEHPRMRFPLPLLDACFVVHTFR